MAKTTQKISQVQKETQYYNFPEMFSLQHLINFIIGARRNGKSYGAMKHFLQLIHESNYKDYILFVRRFNSQVTQSLMCDMMTALQDDNVIYEATKGKYNTFHFYPPNMVFANYDPETGKTIKSKDIILSVMTLENVGKYKNTNHPNAMWMLFEEFIKLEDEYYYKNEIERFETIAGTFRRGDRVYDKRFFFIGNTEDFISPYFSHYNVPEIEEMSSGMRQVFTTHFEEYNKSVDVLVDYTKSLHMLNQDDNAPVNYDHVDPMFLFGTSGKMHVFGEWNLKSIPNFPTVTRTTRTGVKHEEPMETRLEFKFLMQYDTYFIHCELHTQGDIVFIHHRQLTYEPDFSKYEIVFTNQFNLSPNVFPSPYIFIPFLNTQVIYDCYKNNKLTYEDRNAGNIVKQYLKECRKA